MRLIEGVAVFGVCTPVALEGVFGGVGRVSREAPVPARCRSFWEARPRCAVYQSRRITSHLRADGPGFNIARGSVCCCSTQLLPQLNYFRTRGINKPLRTLTGRVFRAIELDHDIGGAFKPRGEFVDASRGGCGV